MRGKVLCVALFLAACAALEAHPRLPLPLDFAGAASVAWRSPASVADPVGAGCTSGGLNLT